MRELLEERDKKDFFGRVVDESKEGWYSLYILDLKGERTMEYKGLLELKDFLASDGFKFSKAHDPYGLNLCNWYAYRKTIYTAPFCACNEKEVQIVVYPNLVQLPGMPSAVASVEVDLCAQRGYNPDTNQSRNEPWFKLKAYSLKPEVLQDRLANIEHSLISAWIAVNE